MTPAVRDASRVDSSWECTAFASGMPAAVSPNGAGLWPHVSLLAAPDGIPQARLPPSASSVLHRHTRSLSFLSRQSSVEMQDLRYLFQLANVTRPLSTGETGFASGLSALAIMAALQPGAKHVSIDPFQPAFQLDGLRGATEYSHQPGRPAFAHVNETAAFGLSSLLRQRQCFDLLFLDDGHKFEDNVRAPPAHVVVASAAVIAAVLPAVESVQTVL